MNLENGKYYLNAQGKAVKCQIEEDKKFHLYDPHGEKVGIIPATTEYVEGKPVPTHVEGWQQIGKKDFDEHKKNKNKKSRKKKSKKKAK